MPLVRQELQIKMRQELSDYGSNARLGWKKVQKMLGMLKTLLSLHPSILWES